VPATLTPPNVSCINGRPDLTGSCREPTGTGDYYPAAYFAPAAALGVATNTGSALWIARGASAAVSLAFLLLAVALLATDTGWSLLGLLASITPMVLFIASVINPSGLELSASLALAASALRLTREPRRAPRWVWASLAASGAVTILAWQTGPIFAVADLLAGFALLGPNGWSRLRKRSGRDLAWCGLVLAASTVVFAVYSRVSGVAHGTFRITPFFHSLRIGIEQLPDVLRQAVGNFGLLTVPLPSVIYWSWWLLVLALLLVAVRLGDRVERLILASVTAVALLFPVLAYAWSYRLSGFGIQGRQVLPLLMLVPLLAGEVIYRRTAAFRERRIAGWLLGTGLAVICLLQLFAWWINARYWGAHTNGFWLFGHPIWQPPGGWLPWALLALLGACAPVLGALGETAASGRRPRQSVA
jgi:hypothetical protein